MRYELNRLIFPVNSPKSQNVFNQLNFLIPLLMGIYVFVNPLPLSALSRTCLYFSLFILLILISFKKATFSLRTPLTLPFALFSLWAVFGLFFTLDFNNTLHDLRVHLLNYLIAFYLLVNYFDSLKRLEALSVIVIASATVSSLWTIVSYYLIDGFPLWTRLGLGANFKDMPAINLGFITLPAIGLAFLKLRNSTTITTALLALSIAILIGTTFLTQSRGTLFGLLAGLIIFCFSNKKFIFVVISAIVLALMVPGLKDRFDPEIMIHDERNKTNYLAMEVIKIRPIAGVGFGMQIYGNQNLVDLNKLHNQAPAEYRQNNLIRYPHNTILDIAVRTGLVGLALFLFIVFALFHLLWKAYRMAISRDIRSWSIGLTACFVSYLVPALFTDTTSGARAVMFYIMAAMAAILHNLALKEMSKGKLSANSSK